MTLDAARAAVISGDGVVARYPGVLCVARCRDRETLLQLLDLCAGVAGPDPGRTLARRLARWMGGADAPDEDLEFGTLAVTGEQLGVFLVGNAAVTGGRATLSGADAATWTDRLIPLPDVPVVLSVAGAVPPPDLPSSLNDLRAGVVSGAGAMLFPVGGDQRAPSADQEEGVEPRTGRARTVPRRDGRGGGTSGGPRDGRSDEPEGNGTVVPLGPWTSARFADARASDRSGYEWFADWSEGPGSGEVELPSPAPAAEQQPVPGHDGSPWDGSAWGTANGEVPAPPRGSPLAGVPASDATATSPGPASAPQRDGRSEHLDDDPVNGGRHAILDPGATDEPDPGPAPRSVDARQLPDVAYGGGSPGHLGADEPAEGAPPDPDGYDPAEVHPLAGAPVLRAVEDPEAPDEPGAGQDIAPGTPVALAVAEFAPQAAEPVAEHVPGPHDDMRDAEAATPATAVPALQLPRPVEAVGVLPDGVPGPAAGEAADPAVVGLAARPGRVPTPAPRQPDPIDGPDRDPTVEQPDPGPAEHESLVEGRLCEQDHLNDPRSESCVLCGVPLGDGDEPLVVGVRPPLGRIVFDDGAAFTVDAEYLVGRMPGADPRARTGELLPIVVEDRSGSVSRVHAEILIHGWDVVLVDSGSRNGTFVAGPDDPGWTPLAPGRTSRLLPGTRVRMGGRTFVFEPAGSAY
ncbi:MAG: hypothetical protein QOF00_1240 [Pseudonocardiales bacterium]|nr:hypothetical protein [Pseudonocardiales bacterium]